MHDVSCCLLDFIIFVTKMMKVLLPFLLCTANPGVSTGASFVASPLAISGSSSSSSPSSSASVHHRHSSNSGCRPAAAASSSSTPPFVSSDLKSFLPTPKKRTLRLDKFGRRVHDLTDDGTAKYNMKGEGGGDDEQEEDATRPKSAKEMAAEASSADFHLPASATTTGADLKALLPKGVTKKGQSSLSPPSSSSPPGPSLSQILGMLNDGTTTTTASAASDATAAAAARAKSDKERAADASRAQFHLPPISPSSRSGGSDLKALLPRQKSRFMKLDVS